jgi:hypothetical protein
MSDNSGDEETQDRGNDSQGRHSHLGDADDGEFMDVDEDNDLNGKDAAALEDVFRAEVRSMTVFVLSIL